MYTPIIEYGKEPTVFKIAGGAGTVAYTLAEIARAARQINGVAHEIDVVVGKIGTEIAQLQQIMAGVNGGAAISLIGLEALKSRCGQACAEVRALGGQVETVTRNYSSAEAAAEARAVSAATASAIISGLTFWRITSSGVPGPKQLIIDLFVKSQRAGDRDATEQSISQLPAFLAGMGGFAGLAIWAAAGGGQASGSALSSKIRTLTGWLGLSQPGQLSVRPLQSSEWKGSQSLEENWRPGHAATAPYGKAGQSAAVKIAPTLAGVLEGSKDAYGYPPGSIAVDRIERPNGTHAWIVHLPGTEDWGSFDSSNPFDMEGNLEGMTAQQSRVFSQQQVMIQELMKKALADAGALPGEDTLITGHSGGGIHAAAAAANPAFLAQVNVKMIVIAGAPAAEQKIGPNISVVDLQNEDDIVTALDLKAPPKSENWTTITSQRPVVAGHGILGHILDAHSPQNYLNDAKQLEGSNHPAIAGAKNQLNNFFTGDAAPVVTGAAAVGVTAAGAAIGAGSLSAGTLRPPTVAAKSNAAQSNTTQPKVAQVKPPGGQSTAQIKVHRTVYQGVDVNQNPAAQKPAVGTLGESKGSKFPQIGGR